MWQIEEKRAMDGWIDGWIDGRNLCIFYVCLDIYDIPLNIYSFVLIFKSTKSTSVANIFWEKVLVCHSKELESVLSRNFPLYAVWNQEVGVSQSSKLLGMVLHMDTTSLHHTTVTNPYELTKPK